MIRFIVSGLFCLFWATVVFAQSGLSLFELSEPNRLPLDRTPFDSGMRLDGGVLLPFSKPSETFGQVQATSPAATLTGESAAPPAGGSAGGSAAGGGGGNNGTNPAAPATTFMVNNEFFRLNGGDGINTVYTRFKYPWFGGKGGITLEIPYVYYNLSGSTPNVPHIGGLGDIAINTTYNAWQSENKKLTVVGLFNSYIPTADNLLLARSLPTASLAAFNLGTGKYVLAPGIAFVYAFAPNFFVAPTYLYEASAFGVEERPDIRRGKFRLFSMYAWESGVYLLPEFQALTNYQNGNTDFYLAPELGYTAKGTTVSVKPGYGIDQKPGERAWGLSLTVKVNF